jgi:xylulokinase
MTLAAGLDIGTQGVKLLVLDAVARRVVAIHAQPLELLAGTDGSREQQPEWWVAAVRQCFARLDPAMRREISVLGVSGQQHGFVPLGGSGEVLAPAKLWCDTSTQRECALIMDAVGGADQCIALAGNPVLAGYTASKLPWTRRHRPAAYEELATILLPHDYINFWLTGERWMEAGDASGTGWFDVRARRWSAPMLQATDPGRDLARCLPALVDANAKFTVAPAVAESLGLREGVLVSAGGGDNMMAAIGTGNVAPGVLTMSLGTSGTLFTCADRPVVDPAGGWAAFCSSTGSWLPLICTMNCTVATENVARAFGFDSRDGDALLAATRPGASGLGMLPFFNGERTPDLPNARASFHGIDFANFTRANAYRAAMEGATYALRNGFDSLRAAGLDFSSIRLTGGGSRSPVWRQMVADVFGLPVEVPAEQEGAAFGAALQALWACTTGGSQAELHALAREHVKLDAALGARPDSSASAAYAAAYQRFLRQLQIELDRSSIPHSD